MACPSPFAPPVSPATPNAKDWSIHDDGREIGRLYEDLTASRPAIGWFWSITVMGPARRRVKTDGRASTLEEAKAQFAAAWTTLRWSHRTRNPGRPDLYFRPCCICVVSLLQVCLDDLLVDC